MMNRLKDARMGRSRKAQVYPVLITLFTIVILTMAFINISSSKVMKNSAGKDKKIGEYQAEVFASLQDADSINFYLEKNAELAAQFALNDLEKSCMVNINPEHTTDPLESQCGKYIYPLWSTNVSICLPDCMEAFKQSFQEYFLTGISSYKETTSILLPISYDVRLDAKEKQFTIKGIASNDKNLNVISLDQKKDYPVDVQPDFTAVVSDQQAAQAPETPAPVTEPAANTFYDLLGWPVDDSSLPNLKHYLVSCFGQRPSSGTASSEHPGIDIAAPAGTPVLAAYDGEVVAAGGKAIAGKRDKEIATGKDASMYDCWGMVVIRHNAYLSTQYLHMNTIDANIVPGAQVKKGQRIGTVGTRGSFSGTQGGKQVNVVCDTGAFGAHLHFTVAYDRTASAAADAKETYTKDKISQDLFVKETKVQPFCFLKKGDYNKKPKEQNDPECFTPINLESNLDEVCGMYDFDFSPPPDAPKQAPAVSPAVKEIGASYSEPKIPVDKSYFGQVPPREREGEKITKIVLHHTGGGTVLSAVKTWIGLGGNASAHYIIDTDGTIYYIIDESKKSNNAGCRVDASECPVKGRCAICRSNPPPATNQNSIGIEIINSGSASDKYTDAQYRSISALLKDISSRYGISLNDQNVIAHYEITSDKWDPSPNFDWARIGLADHITYQQADPVHGCAGLRSFGYSSSCAVSNQITASVVEQLPPSLPETDNPDASMSLSNEFGTYSFKPSFSVKVNKDLNDPVAPITTWFEKTWQECENNFTGCVEKKMSDFNSVEGRKFDLSFADRCEANPDFYNMMEFTEDCLSNGAYKCGCEFNTSMIQSSRNMNISFDFLKNKVTLYIEKDGKFEEAESHQLYFGSLGSAAGKYGRMDYLLNFKKDGSLDTARLMAYSRNDDGSYSLDPSASLTNYLKLQIAKPEKADAGVLFNDPRLLSCVYKKNKFRLCAKPSAPELSTLKFAITIKEKPPAPLAKDAVSVTPTVPCQESDVKKILDVKGIDLTKIASMVPIPGLNVIGITDVINNLPDSKPSSLQIAINNPDPDIAGYEVYCNDILTDMLPADVLNRYNPNNFVTIANNQIGSQTSQLDSFVRSNSYTAFLDGTDCGVPVTRPNGETVKVPAIKGLTKDGKTVFSIDRCGNVPVILSKMLPNNYCVSVIPVDKNGNKMNQFAYSNCAQTNTLLNLAIKDLLDRQLGDFLVIPDSFLPKELKPQAEQPCPGKISAIASGKGLDLMKLANYGGVDYLKSYLQTAASDMINSEVTATALVNSVNGLNSMWAKQAVFSTLSNEIKNEDAKFLFDSAISGSMSGAARGFVLSKGTKYITDEKAKEIIGKAAMGEGVDSIANSELRSALAKELTADQKRQDIISTINDARGGELEQKIIKKAVEKRCGDYDMAVKTAIDCLDDKDVEEAYGEALLEFRSVEQGGSAALIQKGIDKIGPSKTKDVLSNVVDQNYRGLVSDMVQAELSKMPDASKREFIQDALQGKMPDASMIQPELLRMAVSNNNEYVTKILQGGNIRDLLQDTLKTELEKQLKSFIVSECKPKNALLQ